MRRAKRDAGRGKEERRAKLLRQCATFLASLTMQSDQETRASGRKRSEFAQAQYDFARDLADSITEELKHG
jgi:hypothetical protein